MARVTPCRYVVWATSGCTLQRGGWIVCVCVCMLCVVASVFASMRFHVCFSLSVSPLILELTTALRWRSLVEQHHKKWDSYVCMSISSWPPSPPSAPSPVAAHRTARARGWHAARAHGRTRCRAMPRCMSVQRQSRVHTTWMSCIRVGGAPRVLEPL